MKFNALFHSKEDLANEFGIHIDVMKYSSLISAIPSGWKLCEKEYNIMSYFSSRWGDNCKAL